MKKDAYYFPHFSNARNDRKIKRIIKELGVEGYGIYFMLLEVLREQTEFKYPIEDIDLLADEFRTSEPKVRTVICNYELFEVDKKQNFFSPKQVLYLQPYIEKTERAREAALIRWNNVKKKKCKSNTNAYANALPEQSKSNARKGKEKKGEKSKLKDYSQAFIDAFNDFREMRIKIKKPMTDRAESMVIKKLDELAPNNESMKIKILEQSIMNSWQGVFELKYEQTSLQFSNPVHKYDQTDRRMDLTEEDIQERWKNL